MPHASRPTIASILILLVTLAFALLPNKNRAEPAFAPLAAAYPGIASSSPAEWFKSPATARVPVLVYHIVRPSYPSDSLAIRTFAQMPELFDAQMKHLSDNGYHVVSFAALENYFRFGVALPFDPVILSFDDGWSGQYAYAFPILRKYGYTATFFVFTNAIGSRGFLSWDELFALRDAGMTIGSHTVSHPYLRSISGEAERWHEIVSSKRILEERLGVPIREFAYPFGQYDAQIITLVEKAGYASARGDTYTGDQAADRLYELSAINAPTSMERFEELFPR